MIHATNGEGQAGFPGHTGNLQAGPTATRPTYRLIQVLRAVAAIMVVLHHSTILLQQRDGLPIATWVNGGAGVDIFFVISGFVMQVSSAPLRHTLHPARTFLARRLERIVPLYWLATTAKLVTLLAAPAIMVNALGSAWHVVASYLFIFSQDPQHNYQPLLIVGWTLNYEMLFYLLFAAVLAWRADLLKVLAPVLIGMMLLQWAPPGLTPAVVRVYESSMLLEFLAGIALARALPWVKTLNPWVAAGMAGVAFAVLGTWLPGNLGPWRGFEWGLPAAIIVAAALALEQPLGRRVPRWMLELGDASYSIYLVHTFVLPVVGIGLARLGTHWVGVIPVSLVMAVVASTLCGVLVYRSIELPITKWFKGRRRTAIPANA